jgi:hypothetical protein
MKYAVEMGSLTKFHKHWIRHSKINGWGDSQTRRQHRDRISVRQESGLENGSVNFNKTYLSVRPSVCQECETFSSAKMIFISTYIRIFC